jgi:hypothetical protein
MKSTIKLVFVAVLFCSTVFAEGDLGNGNRNCPNGQTTCLVASQPNEIETKITESEVSILTVAQEYLDSIFKYFEN